MFACGSPPVLPRLKKLWADAACRGQELTAWCKAEGGWDLEVVERPPGLRGFSLLPRRWVVERILSWLSRNSGFHQLSGAKQPHPSQR